MPRTLRTTPRLLCRFIGGSTLFNGTTSTIPTTITSNNVFKTGNGFTLFAWVKPKSVGEGGLGRIFDKSAAGSGGSGIALYIEAVGKLTFYINGATGKSSPTGKIQFNRWQHVAVSVSGGSKAKMYLNGEVISGETDVSAIEGITTSLSLIHI